ncbi:D-alanine--D-alanine ligase family protein [Virgisporangium ochraceum]|uniref:D-alanine--D-alanine ligase n=1 Tax=Virgisporangium ochraceum TaxID=65505 RepID=A0A8J4EC96_9ACTN|nr:D-alanine--D-alanine ligase family protein [Virgisporangium ochraceum]GIJ69298.1 D-alanine--D-alanine ligase [Virgisporangium ochraceum]
MADSSVPAKPRVAVVFGGRSTEHAISCVSAGNVLAALDPDEFEVVPVGITQAGGWVLATGGAVTAIEGRRLPAVTNESGTAVVLPADPTMGQVEVVDARQGVQALTGVDVVFPLLHGAYGEDGTIQGLLEMAGLPYVGAGVFASAAGMDKEFTKRLAAADGIPVGPYTVLRAGQSLSADDRGRLGLPVFVKPSRAGSSIGITRVTDWADLDAAVAKAREIDPKVIIEAAVVGREVECGVLEGEHGGPPEASVVGEISVPGGFYDFDAKYLDDVAEISVPADLPPEVSERVRELAVRTFVTLDCAGLARVDFFVGADNEVYLNEINTMPGFTPISLFPVMWAASGLEYPKLVSRLVRTALRRGTGLH